MSALRSSPWSLDQTSLQTRPHDGHVASTSTTLLWCDSATAGTSQWTLVSCDVAAQRAIFTVDTTSTLRVRCESEASTQDDQQQQPPLFVSAACLLLLVGYLVSKLVALRRVQSASKSSRCLTVDAFRGLTICLMVFVNYGGGGLTMFQHSVWDGLTVADVVFPCFAWIMGFTMQLSSAGRPHVPWDRIVARTTKLFFLGLFLNNGSSWATWRIPGVLQSLAVAYFLVTCLTRAVAWLLMRQQQLHSKPVSLSSHFLLGVMPLIALNLTLTFELVVSGCPKGYLGPGGDVDAGLYRNCTGGAHLYVDRLVFGERHIYQTPTCQSVFHTGPFDPEGLLNWLMVAVTTYLGFVGGASFTAGSSGSSTASARGKVTPFLVTGGVCLFICVVLTSGMKLIHWTAIPVNKNLWSLSYVLASVAGANVVFSLLLLLNLHTDNQQHQYQRHPKQLVQTWVSTVVDCWSHVGRNSIVVYALHEIFQAYVPFSTRPFAGHAESDGIWLLPLIANVAGVLWWIVVAEWLHGLNVFVSV